MKSKPIYPTIYENEKYNKEGMTLREHYAGLAMLGIISNPKLIHDETDLKDSYFEIDCVKIAESLIYELNKEQ